jgi:phage terminase large subunit-like protein
VTGLQPSATRYAKDPAAFIDDFIPRNEKGQPWRLSAYQRTVLALAFAVAPLRILLWSEPKKSGKTFVNAALGLWWGFTRPNTEIIVVANDLEQSVGRVFKTMADLIKHNPALKASATVRASSIVLTNGTVITAIASEYRGAAGSRHSLKIDDEIWGCVSEASQRLFEELTPPPTEPDAWVLIGTYAGFIGESHLLERLYQRGMAGERVHEDLELYRDGDLFMFWSHTARQPWQTESYYAEQRRTLRPNAYARLHENRWVTGTEQFITEALWDGCVDPDATPLLPRKDCPLYVGVDASTKHDSTAVVAVTREADRFRVALHKIWRPSPDTPLDLEATVEAFLRELCLNYHVEEIRCDPFQLHRSIMTLQKARLPIAEFPQTVSNTTRMGQVLFDALNGRNLVLYPSAELRTQALSTIALESARGWRVAKEKTTKKIDAIVALAMACVSAIDAPQRNKEAVAVVLAEGITPGRSHPAWQDRFWGAPANPGHESTAMRQVRAAKERALAARAQAAEEAYARRNGGT